jgi:flagellar operon protein (TIGR03826 family)
MSTDVRQCRECGRIFNTLGSDTCPACAEELDESFRKVKNYLYDHPTANVVEISKGTEVPEKTVLHFLKEGRLSIDESTCSLECERCGAPISGGRFCKSCQNMFQTAFKSVCPEQRPSAKREGTADTKQRPGLGKMHFDYRGK